MEKDGRDRHTLELHYAFRKLVNGGLLENRFITFTCWVGQYGIAKAWEHLAAGTKINLN
jgi:hypothetical protein